MLAYILNIPENRSRLFDDTVSEKDTFFEPVDHFSQGGEMICLISNFPDSITHVAAAQKSIVRPGTGMSRLNISDILALPKSISFDEIFAGVSRKVVGYLRRKSLEGGLLALKSTDEIIKRIGSLSPEAERHISQISPDRKKYLRGLTATTKRIIALQKDSIITALKIAEMPAMQAKDWQPPRERPPASFLDGLSQAYLREDTMINNDLHQIPGFNLAKQFITGSAVFSDATTILTVITANRTALENVLGVDLIYYNENYRSFVMVQYKAMEKKNFHSDPVFRFPQKQLSDEIKRMKMTLGELKSCSADGTLNGFRFCDNPFFFKFCPRVVLDPNKTGLTPGMYVHLNYWDILEAAAETLGPKKGRYLGYENVGRYLDNSDFITLVRKAWVGTTPSQSVYLDALINNLLQNGHSITLAVKKRENIGPGYRQ